MFPEWLNPLLLILSFFGLLPLMIVSDDGQNNEEDKLEKDENENEITDETDLATMLEDPDQLDEILMRDDVDIDKYLDAIKGLSVKAETDQHIFFKDIKVDKKDPGADDKTNLADDDKTASDDSKLHDDNKSEIDGLKAKEDKTSLPPEVKPGDLNKPFTVDQKFITDEVAKFKEANKDKAPDVLNSMVDKYTKILETVKGDVFTPHNFKIHVNAQTYISNIKTPFAPDWKPDPSVTSKPDYIALAAEHKNNKILRELQNKFDGIDLPLFSKEALTDKEARKEFERDLIQADPAAYDEYKTILKESEARINEEFDRWYYVDQNWETMAADTISSDIKLFTDFLSSKGIKPEEIGLPDLTLDKDLYNPFLYENVLYKAKGKPNDDVFSFFQNKYPVVKPFSVLNTLKDIFFDSITASISQKARIEGYELGKKDVIEPGMSNSTNPGERDIINMEDSDSILGEDYTNESKDAFESRIDKFLNKVRTTATGGPKAGKRK